MRKRILALMTVAALAIITTGCEDIDSTASSEEEKTVKEYDDKTPFGEDTVKVYTDPETGTEYLIFRFGSSDKKQWKVVPRYLPDGSIKQLD